MYSLDINFLKSRSEHRQGQFTRTTTTPLALGNQTSILLGIAIGVIFPSLVAAGWLFLQSQNAQLENKVAAIDAELNRLGLQEANIKKIQEQSGQIQAETKALATVFNQIRPWSAMLQDLRDRIPKSVQIESIKQIAAVAPQPAAQPAANGNNASAPAQSAPLPAGGIEISGIARSFSDVNDFLLTLKQSAFLQPSETKIITAELAENPVAAPSASDAKVKLPQVVKYTIQSNLSNVPASDILRELERKGTFGLVTRIRTLQQTGVIQP
jgi:type IV pilus assembly protein PilN